MDHVGIDVHKREARSTCSPRAVRSSNGAFRTEPERVAAVLGPRPRARILIEASTDREWVARCLEALGPEVIVADPNFTPMYATRTPAICDTHPQGEDRPYGMPEPWRGRAYSGRPPRPSAL